MDEKDQILILRRKGKSYSEISDILKIPKSTVAWRLKDFRLSSLLKKLIIKRTRDKWRKNIIKYNKIFAKKRSEEARMAREKIQNKYAKKIKHISGSALKLIGSVLYWAEGNKKHRWYLRFANSDPDIIRVIMKFFRVACNIPSKNIKGRVHIYPGLNYKKTLRFWSGITQLPKNNFYKPQIHLSIASKKKRLHNTLPYGTLHLIAGNTQTTSMVKGWIQGISEKI